MLITKEFTFDSAHKLEWDKDKCKNLHGHTYRLQVSVKGNLNSNGIVIDFRELKKIVNNKIISVLDHRFLNEIIPNPTAENISVWIWDKLKNEFKDDADLFEIKVWEGLDSFAAYKGD